MSSLLAKKYFQDYKLVATEVGSKVPILKDTSCMSLEKRLDIAACRAFREFFSHDGEFNKFLKEVAEPTLSYLGFAEWSRDILTDMGLRVTYRRQTASLKKLKHK